MTCGNDTTPETPGVVRSVGPAGFEPTTSCTPSKRATKLRHGPMTLFYCLAHAPTIALSGSRPRFSAPPARHPLASVFPDC